jgi:hypothetical protein
MNSFIQFQDKKDYNLCLQWLHEQSLGSSVMAQSAPIHISLLQPRYHLGKEEGLHKEKGWRGRLLGQNSE